jgi:predicted PurR-regulated permease PerM
LVLLNVIYILVNLTLPIYTFNSVVSNAFFFIVFIQVIQKKEPRAVKDILTNIRVAINSYIVGLIIEMILVSTMTTLGFMVIGVNAIYWE